MIPQRFTIEYAQRCEQLLKMLEPQARDQKLIGSFAILVASAAFNIPFARVIEPARPVGDPEPKLRMEILRLQQKSFLNAPFWGSEEPGFFRYATIVNATEYAHGWRDEKNQHPIKSTAAKDGTTVLHIIRNALAHGNIVYLNDQGAEVPNDTVRYLAFLSKVRDQPTHRVAIFDEESFLHFLKKWIGWLKGFPVPTEFDFSKAAE